MAPDKEVPASVAHVQRLFLQHFEVIKGFIFGIMPDHAAVEDVLHEVFLVVTQKSDAFAVNSDFMSWSCTIARNKVLQRLKTERRHSFEALSVDAIDALCAIPQPNSSSALELNSIETETLRLCMEELAPKARQTVELRYRDACRPPEIAKRMNWTVGAVSVTLSRALSALRGCVQRKLAKSEIR
jgi:RNA polymerase sigma-70 factor (ECF subfamily)